MVTHSGKLKLIEFHVVEHCNLNCKSCMHFSPLAEKNCIKLIDFKKDVSLMAKITQGNVETINILGGEPLLHPNILKILKLTRIYFPNSVIRIVSNGILVLNQKDIFWKTLKKYNIQLSITRYPLNINYQKIIQITKKYNIDYTFYGMNKENSQWHFPLDLSGSQNMDFNFRRCSEGNNCTNINILKGKLYVCPVVSNIKYFNKFFNYSLPVLKEDYLNLKDIANIKDIINFISHPTPFCRFCNVQARTFNNKWEISKKDISEWI